MMLDGLTLEEAMDIVKENSQKEPKSIDQEKNIDLVIGWFEHIALLADDRKTEYGFVMNHQDAMDEIKALALRSRNYVKKFMKKS